MAAASPAPHVSHAYQQHHPFHGVRRGLEHSLSRSVRQRGTGSPFDRSQAHSPVVDLPSRPLVSVEPAFRLHVAPEAPPPSRGDLLRSPVRAAATQREFLRSRSGLGGTIGGGGPVALTCALQSAAATARELAVTTVGSFGSSGGPPPKLTAAAAAAVATSRAADGARRPAPRLGVWGGGPPPALPYAVRKNPANTELRAAFDRSDLPCFVLHGSVNRLQWRVPPASLDLAHYLPLFASGLREVELPYSFIAERGLYDLLNAVSDDPPRVAAVVPLLIMPLRNALNTRVRDVITRTITALIAIASVGAPPELEGGAPGGGVGAAAAAATRSGAGAPATLVGAALLPYYRQLLPVLNLYATKSLNIGDAIEYGQRFKRSSGERVQGVLHALERTGGPTAFINIKYVIPTFVSGRA